jgi:hypothetical protein
VVDAEQGPVSAAGEGQEADEVVVVAELFRLGIGGLVVRVERR